MLPEHVGAICLLGSILGSFIGCVFTLLMSDLMHFLAEIVIEKWWVWREAVCGAFQRARARGCADRW